MALFIFPPVTISGVATETTLVAVKNAVDDLETTTAAILNKMGASAFTLTYDQQVFTYDATHDYIKTRLASADRQLLTITYSDTTKTVINDISIITYS